MYQKNLEKEKFLLLHFQIHLHASGRPEHNIVDNSNNDATDEPENTTHDGHETQNDKASGTPKSMCPHYSSHTTDTGSDKESHNKSPYQPEFRP